MRRPLLMLTCCRRIFTPVMAKRVAFACDHTIGAALWYTGAGAASATTVRLRSAHSLPRLGQFRPILSQSGQITGRLRPTSHLPDDQTAPG